MRLNMQFYFVCFMIFNFNKKGYSRLIRRYLGCYQHFDQYVVQKDKSSVTTCIEECETDHRLYTFAALKNGTECYCGNNFRISTQESNCQKRCKDSSNEICGGEQHYSVYSICIIGSHGQHCDKPCSNCKCSVPCMRNNGECYLSKCHKNSNEKCDIARFFNDVNIAFNRPAYQNSTYQDDQRRKYPASLAVDGKNDSNFESGKTCSHTNDDDKPWFYVDLEAERDVKKVIITNRDDHNANRLHGARVHLTNNPPNGTDYYCGYVAVTPSVPKTELECRSSSKNRYVAVTLSKKEFLTICEIEVYVGDCQNAGDCGSSESCVNLNFNGRYHKRCSCKEGFYKENVYSQCTDINECKTNHSCNATTSSCVNNVGSYTCQCKEGYVNAGYNIKCVDEDECKRYNPVCDKTSSICRNSDGSYHCECKTGYQRDVNNRNKCKDIDECQNSSSCDSRSSTCRNKDGSYVCECKVGYHGFNSYTRTCMDINECDQRKCDASSTTCENVIGSFKCHCKPGFKPLSHNICSDIDECTEGNHNCDLSTTTCKNVKGSFSCDCKVGFEKVNSNNTSCRDVDECSRNVCDIKSTNCQNNHGSYLCHCKDGYTTLHQNKCSDMDECSTNNHDCDEQTSTCKNFEGGYKCHCLGGYENINGNGKSCRDINECESVAFNKTSTECKNTIGSYELRCWTGFEIKSGVCEDINECDTQNFTENVICNNLIGSVKFLCADGYYLDTEDNVFICKAQSNAGKIVAVLFVMLLLILLGTLFVLLWKRKQDRKGKENVNPKVLELSNTITPTPKPEVIYNNVDPKQSATRIKTEDLSAHIRTVSEKDSSGFENEFKAIPKVMDFSTSYAQQQELKPLNRFQNIFPYDHTRVILSNTGEKFSDYINASHVTGFENTVPIIAAQGPTDQTVNDFWRMITEENVNVIVMLTQLIENNKDKCFLYWPESDEGSTTEFGNISVTRSSVVVWEKFVRRDFKVVKEDDNTKRIVTQWQFLGWPDHGVPTDVQSFLRFRNNVRAWMDKSGKTLVHCSAGVGRTGCFIAIDVLLEDAATRGSVDVVSCVSELRRQRPHMVQTAVQYDFIYFALKLAFEEGTVYIPIPTFHKRYLEMYKINKDGKSKIVEEFENLIKATSEEIKNSSTSKKLTAQSDKWKVYSADSVTPPNKYIFSRFPSESDVEKFWEMCMEHANVIVLLDHIKDFKLPFLPNNIKSLVCKGFTLDCASTLPMGILSIDTVTASSENDLIYENRTDLANQSRQFRVIRVCVNNKDFLSKELFQAIKAQADLVPNNNPNDGSMSSTFAVSRDNVKLASFYVACCKLFEQMESYKEVSIYNTVLDLHKGSCGPIFTLAQYKKLFEIIDKEVIARKPFQLL